MNLSERAKQPEICIDHYDCGTCDAYLNYAVTLERGVALELAAQECDRHAAFCKTEAENGGNVEHLLTRKAEADYNAERIRSLDPDAEQALAAHDAELRATMTEQFQSYTIEHAAAHDAEIERRVKLEAIELIVFHCSAASDDQHVRAESKPAPAEGLNTLIDNQRVALGEARIDINNLLALLMAHQENTKEYLESDDAAVLNDIEERWRTPSGRNWLKDHDAEIERRTRLDEHLKICKQCGIGMRCERGNWLFQPAPTGEPQTCSVFIGTNGPCKYPEGHQGDHMGTGGEPQPQAPVERGPERKS